MPVSMTEESHCYENAQAERLNGILKQEYGPGGLSERRQRRGARYGRRSSCTTPGGPMPPRLHDTEDTAQPDRGGVKLSAYRINA